MRFMQIPPNFQVMSKSSKLSRISGLPPRRQLAAGRLEGLLALRQVRQLPRISKKPLDKRLLGVSPLVTKIRRTAAVKAGQSADWPFARGRIAVSKSSGLTGTGGGYSLERGKTTPARGLYLRDGKGVRSAAYRLQILVDGAAYFFASNPGCHLRACAVPCVSHPVHISSGRWFRFWHGSVDAEPAQRIKDTLWASSCATRNPVELGLAPFAWNRDCATSAAMAEKASMVGEIRN